MRETATTAARAARAARAATAAVDPAATKVRLLDVAERLFAERGFDGVSLRQITAEAGANLAAVNYHFGCKEALILAVVKRCLQPLNSKRLSLLAEVTGRARERGGAPTIGEITGAFVRPALELYRGSGQSLPVSFRLIGRCMLDNRQSVSRGLMEEFREVVEKFGAAFGGCLPHLTPTEVTMRVMFMAGAIGHTILNMDRIAALQGEEFENPSMEALASQMVEFVAAGFAGGKRE